MKDFDEQRRTARFVDVVTPVSGWSDGDEITVYRFPNDETGHGRAVEYRNAYNESLRVAMDVSQSDLELDSPDFGKRPDVYDRAVRAGQYRDHTAGLSYPEAKQFISNDDPMPTDYPHNF